ncbi:MAG: hypothetical protein V7L22_28845 [Nostoc sp.]
MPIVIAFASGVPVGAASPREGYGAQWNKAKQSARVGIVTLGEAL